MIQLLKNRKGAVARFGKGMVRLRAYVLKTRFGGQIELTQCGPTPAGQDPGECIPGSNKIVLDFTTLESLDVVISKLQDLRDDMAHDSEV